MAQNVAAVVVHSRVRVNKFYRAALETQPQYVQAVALRAELLAAQQQLPGIPAVSAPTAGDDLGAWLDTVVETEQADRVRAIKAAALTGQIHQCDLVVEDLAVSATDEILASLHGNLVEIMAKVATIVDKLNGARDPSGAINAGVAAEWKRLSPLRIQYDQLRQAQQWQMAGEPEDFAARNRHPDDEITDLEIADLDQVLPDRDTRTVSFVTGAPVTDPRPWPTGDPVAELVWLATSATPWIPTIAELRQLNRQRQARANQPPADDPDDGGAMHQTTKQTFAIR